MVGRSILHYQIIEEIGQGGMGVVYRAEDTKLKRTVALKFLLPHILSSEEEKARFIHEAQAAASLHHPNICTIHEINEADGQTFIAMACIEGESLSERLTRGPMKPTEALRVALQVAQGLKAAHRNGIVHRDIKSSNIMVAEDGRATIMDFGLATSAHQTHATQRGAKMGTIAYMSPEQTRGDAVDHRTDIWALGVLLYEMLAGRRPFRGDYDEAIIYSILNEDPESVVEFDADLPAEAWLIIQRAMAKKPENRYQTADEMAEDLEVLYEDIKTGSSSRRRIPGSSGVFRGGAGVPKRPANRGRMLAATAVVILLAVVALFVADSRFSVFPRNTGATTETVTVVDEAGIPIERAIPASEHRRSLMLYFVDNETGDAENDWVGGALMFLLQADLFQDEYLYMRSCVDMSLVERARRAGFDSWFDAPWSLKRETAEDVHVDYFLTGTLAADGSKRVMTFNLYDSRTGRQVSERSYAGSDIFEIVDEATVAIRRDVGLPEEHIENQVDLPVREMLTASTPALRDFCFGIYAALFQQDWSGGVEYMERAVAADSTFAWGNFTLFQFYQAANVRDGADGALRAAMNHIYKLPERMQFILKVNYYGHVQDPEKQLGVAQMMVELYPDALEARVILASILSSRNERRLAVEQYEKALQIDPSRTEFVTTIAEYYRALGEFDRAVEAYESYVQAHPDDPAGYHNLGVAFELEGKYDEARTYYQKVLVLEPAHTRAMCDLGDIEGKLSNDAAALAIWNEALAAARTPQERERIYRSRRNFHSNRGQMQKCLADVARVWEIREEYLPPVAVELEKLGDLVFFVWAGRTEDALTELEALESRLAPPYDGMLDYGYVVVYVQTKEPDKVEQALTRLNAYIEKYNIGNLRGDAAVAAGEMEEARGNFEAAIGHYHRRLELNPTDVIMYRSLGRCYRKLGDPEQAIRELDKVLLIYPNHPGTHYQLALAYYDLENREQAMAHLTTALDRWKNADPVYEQAREARATLAEWQPQSL